MEDMVKDIKLLEQFFDGKNKTFLKEIIENILLDNFKFNLSDEEFEIFTDFYVSNNHLLNKDFIIKLLNSSLKKIKIFEKIL